MLLQHQFVLAECSSYFHVTRGSVGDCLNEKDDVLDVLVGCHCAGDLQLGCMWVRELAVVLLVEVHGLERRLVLGRTAVRWVKVCSIDC